MANPGLQSHLNIPLNSLQISLLARLQAGRHWSRSIGLSVVVLVVVEVETGLGFGVANLGGTLDATGGFGLNGALVRESFGWI